MLKTLMKLVLLDVAVTLLISVRQMLGSNLGRDIGYPD
jgi:hypothetical protein